MSGQPIDLADMSTLGVQITSILSDASSWIEEFELEEKRLENDPQGSLAYALRPNKFSDRRQNVIEHDLMPLIASREIISWHYTRLLPHEIDAFRKHGVRLSDQNRMEDRLKQAHLLGYLSKAEVDDLQSSSPLHDATQVRARSGRFWLVTSRLPASHPGVKLLVSHWGGEVVYFWQRDARLRAKLQSLGSPAVVEAVVPIANTKHTYSVAERIFNSLSKKLQHSNHIDIYTMENLPASAVLRIIGKDDPEFFPAMGGLE